MRAPLIVAGPGLPPGQIVRDTLHALDMMPTMLSMAGTTDIASGRGPDGIDALAALKAGPGRRVAPPRTIYTELFYRAAVRSGDLKAIYQPSRLPIFGPQSKPGEVAWQLFDLSADPGETQDLAGKRRKELERLKADWRRYAQTHRVVLLPEDR
jgi:arylsulfatase